MQFASVETLDVLIGTTFGVRQGCLLSPTFSNNLLGMDFFS